MSQLPKIEISGYSILKKVGEGGMADVYLAKQIALDRPVALKVMLPHLSQDENFGVRFLQEAKCIANLDHQNIVPVYEVGQSGEYYFLSMAYLDGGDLKQRVAKGITEREALEIIKQIASALGVAHRKDIVHRDIKPQNIIFRGDGTPLLTDFGIAKVVGEHDQHLTVTGMMVGSPHYLSPEQALAQPVDQRSDIYSLGVVLYEMLAGVLPFKADSAVATAMQHVTAPLPPLSIEFSKSQALVSKMMAKDASDRFADVNELIVAIDQVLAGENFVEQDERTVIMPSVSAVTPSVDDRQNETLATELQIDATVSPAVKQKTNKMVYIGGSAVLLLLLVLTLFLTTNIENVSERESQVLVTEQTVLEGKSSDVASPSSKAISLVNKVTPLVNEVKPSKEQSLQTKLLELSTTADPKPITKAKPKTKTTNIKSFVSIEALKKSFVEVPAGSFKMGIKKAGVVDARPVHKVTLEKFYISKYPITQAQFSAFKPAGKLSSGQKALPVTNVSWDDANNFARWLSKSGEKGYRLPTESEWEYVARGHQSKRFHWGNGIGKNKANCDGCKSQWDAVSVSPVGSFSANSLGVFDLIGNVWEWTADCYEPNYRKASPAGLAYNPPGCKRRSLRGGAWNTLAKKVHPAFRGATKPTARMNNTGFRLVEIR